MCADAYTKEFDCKSIALKIWAINTAGHFDVVLNDSMIAIMLDVIG